MDPSPLLRLHSLRGQAQEGNWRTDGQCKPGKPGKAVPETITDVWLRMTSSFSFVCVCFFRSFGLDELVMQPSRTHTFWNSGCQVYGFVMICQTLLMYSGLCRRSKRYLHFVFTTHTVNLGRRHKLVCRPRVVWWTLARPKACASRSGWWAVGRSFVSIFASFEMGFAAMFTIWYVLAHKWAMLIICIYKKMTRYTKGFGLLPPEYTSFSHSSFLHFHNLASDMVFTLHLPRKCSVVQTRMTGSNWANDASPAFAAAPQQVPRPWGTGREGKFCEIWRLST